MGQLRCTRLVKWHRGFHHTTGFDFAKTCSLVVKPTTIRTVLTIAITRE